MEIPDLSHFSKHEVQQKIQNDPSSLLRDLGFEFLFEKQGMPKEEAVKQKCLDMIYRQPVSRRPDYIFRNPVYESFAQVWYHPAGFVATISRSRLVGSNGDYSAPRLNIRACREVPMTESRPTLRTSTGRFIQSLEFDSQSPSSPSLSNFFIEVANQGKGQLLSFSQWHIAMSDPAQDGVSNVLDPFCGPIHPWRDLALPWKDMDLYVLSTQTPFMQSNFSKMATERYEKQLRQVAAEEVKAFPLPIRPLMFEALNQSIFYDLPRTKKNEKSRANKFKLSHRVKEIVGKATGFLQNQEYLSPAQSSLLEKWIGEMTRSSRASSIRWNSLPMELPGITNFSRLDLALAVSSQPGIHLKVLNCLKQASVEQLTSWCQGEGCSRPLALSLASVLLNTQNKAHTIHELSDTMNFTTEAMSILLDRVGQDHLVWEDGLGNVWGEALGQNINLPVDEDLEQAQNTRSSHFLSWAIENNISLPRVAIWTSTHNSEDDDNAPSTHQASLLNREDFIQAWRVGARQYCQEFPELYWNMAFPLVSYSRKVHLDGFSSDEGSTSPSPQSRPHPKM